MPPTQKHRFIAIETPLGADALLLTSFSVQESIGRLFQIEAELSSMDGKIKFDDVIGQNATLRVELPDRKTRYFNGYISRFVQTRNDQGYAHYRATLVPWLWFLTRTSDCRIFQDKKAPDIIQEIFKGHGFTDFKVSLSADYRVWTYCVQYRETDFNFVSRLMEQEGIYYYFEHEDGKHTLVLSDSKSAHHPFPGYESIVHRIATDETSDREAITDWVMEKEVQSGGYALNDFDFEKPKNSLRVKSTIARSHAAAEFEIYDYPGEYVEHGEGEAYAKIRMEELQTPHEILRGQATARGICAGYSFALKDYPRADQNREYLVTSASHHVQAGDFGSGQSGGSSDAFSSSFTAMPLPEPFRSARLTPKPLIQGPQTAIIVGPSGEEIYTDKYGRVKVQFHWDRYGKADEKSSCWIRVSSEWAGKKWGAIYLPRIGQEVIVEFLEGDPDRPIITGRVYNGEAMPPYELPGEKTKSTLKSNSSKGGQGFNEIRFEDKKGDEQIFIHGEKNQDVRIKNDCYEWIGNDRHLIVKKDQVEHVEHNRSEVVDADHMEKIGKDRHLKVVGKEAKEVGGSLSLTVKGDVIEVFKANHSEQTTGDYYLKGDNIVIEAMTNITLKVGGSSIAIEASGIGIKTTGEIKIESTGPTEVKATGPLKLASVSMAEMKSPMTTVKGDGMTTIKGGVVMIN